MNVEAELKEMYKITVGDNGVCRGCYDPSDEWYESYYGETIKEITEKLNTLYYKGLPRECYIEKYNVLIYEDRIFDYECAVGRYDKKELQEENDEFNSLWNSESYKNIRQKLINADKEREERAKKLAEIEYKKKQEQKELEEYQKLKEKYEK
jgi:hypothetical protein